MSQKRIHVIVEGRVQGVFFRSFTQLEAKKLGLAGWVRNRPEGTVEALVEGEEAKVDMMIHWFHHGSPMSRVSRVQVTEEEPVGGNTDFEIHYY